MLRATVLAGSGAARFARRICRVDIKSLWLVVQVSLAASNSWWRLRMVLTRRSGPPSTAMGWLRWLRRPTKGAWCLQKK
jgi:hypothetical protein